VRSFLPVTIVAPFSDCTQVGSDPGRDFVGGRERVTPNAENPPASVAKQSSDATVANDVAGDLALPILRVSLWHAAMPRAAVPKAAINKDDESLADENEVGAPGDRLLAAPTGNSRSSQNGDQLQLGSFIAARMDSGHYFGAFFLCEQVRHFQTIELS
jgi:hypothetical protein